MRELIVTEFVSLDGVMEAPGGEPGYPHTGWVGRHFSDGLAAYKLEEQLATDTLLLGRRTYESFAGAWPQREGPMADKINTMEKVVVSSTLGTPGWENAALLGALTVEAIEALKAQEGAPILVVGSRSLVRWLLGEGSPTRCTSSSSRSSSGAARGSSPSRRTSRRSRCSTRSPCRRASSRSATR